MSYGEKAMQHPVPPPPLTSAATYSTENLIPPPPPPPFEISPPVEELIPPPPPPVDTAEVAAKPEEIPPPPLPAEDIKDEDEDHLLLPPSSDDDKTDNDLTPPPPPSSEDCKMETEVALATPLPAKAEGHDLSDEEKAQMELDGFIHPGTDIADGMAQMATEFTYAVACRMNLHEEGDRCLGQLDDLEEFHDPFILLGLQCCQAPPTGPNTGMNVCTLICIIELLPWWSPCPETDGSFMLPWWLNGISNYASESWVLHSDEVQTIAQRIFGHCKSPPSRIAYMGSWKPR
ncbi:hypothetical protein BKA82DRAFT_4020851 [Pisolithus tinctorius]|nr:hypothetical protein BKA82DRAFT_4020851 [Pisolithus tinctorius]